jgi:hypothetical protein
MLVDYIIVREIEALPKWKHFIFQAKECLQRAIGFKRHEISYVMLGKVYLINSDIQGAIEVYKGAVE